MTQSQKHAIYSLAVVILSIAVVDAVLLAGDSALKGLVGTGLFALLFPGRWLFRRKAEKDERERKIEQGAALCAYSFFSIFFLVCFLTVAFGMNRIPSMPSYAVLYFGWASGCIIHGGYAIAVLFLSRLLPTTLGSRIAFTATSLVFLVCVFPSLALAAERLGVDGNQSAYAGYQEDEWVVESPNTITVHSHLNITLWPPTGPLEIELPYDAGVVQDVTYSGTKNEFSAGKILPVSYERKPLEFTQTGHGRYTIRLGDDFHLSKSTLNITWKLPMQELERESDCGPYRARLQGLIPVSYYQLKVALTPDCGYQMLSGSDTENIPFNATLTSGFKQKLGSCSLCIRPASK